MLGPGFSRRCMSGRCSGNCSLRGVAAEVTGSDPVFVQGQARGGLLRPTCSWTGRLIVELKCVESLANEHIAQCINYLKASGLRLALLINFQHAKLEWKRVVFG